MRTPSLLLVVALAVMPRSVCWAADDEVVDTTYSDPKAAAPKPTPVVKPTAPANDTAAVTPPAPVEVPQQPRAGDGGRSSAPIAADPTPEVVQVSHDAERLVKGGNREGARSLINAALEVHPGDPTLTAASKLIDKEDLQGPAQDRVAKAMRDVMGMLRARKDELDSHRYEIGFGGNSERVQAASALPLAGTFSGMAPASAGGRVQPSLTMQESAAVGLRGNWTKELVRMDRVGDYAGALALIDQHTAAVQDPQELRELRIAKASQLVKAERFSDGERDARALLAEGDDARLRGVLSFALVGEGRPGEGLAQAHRAVALDPRNAGVRLARAKAYFALGNDEAGLKDLYAAGQIDSTFQELFRTELRARTSPPAADPKKPLIPLALIAALLGGIYWKLRGIADARAEREESQPVNPMAQLLPVSATAPAGYEIEKEIGRGGMGVVYKARDRRLERTVAIKRLRSEISASPRDRERFVREARLVASLKHQNIMQVFEVGVDEAGPFMVLEYVPGDSLADHLDGRPMRPAEALCLLRPIAAALDFAHEEGVIHQDLKPSNVMLSGLNVKVVDFGIARHMEDTLATLTHARGTPVYMAPEQELRALPRPAADIWSLGAVAYEMLTGARAFSGSLDAKRSRLFRPASQVGGNLPKGIDPVFARCFDPDAAQRWPTASAFVAALASSTGSA